MHEDNGNMFDCELACKPIVRKYVKKISGR